MADEIQTPAGEAAPQENSPVVSPGGESAEPLSPDGGAASASTDDGHAAATEPEPLKRADDEPTVLEGVKADAKAEKKDGDEGADDAAKEEDAAAKGAEEAKAEADKKAAEEKAEADKAAEEAKKEGDEEKPGEKPPLEPVEYKYELPETLKMDDALKADVHGAFDQFRADPSNPQPLIDLHAREMERYADLMNREQHRVFADTRATWRQEWKNDPAIGGEAYDTALTAIARMRDMFQSAHKPGTPEYEKDAQAFDGMLRVTGVGDHPVFARFLHNLATTFDRPAPAATEINPPKDIGRTSRRGLLYDNPRSDPNRQQ